MIPILYEDNHILVIDKPINIPVQQDSSQDSDVLSLLKTYIKEKYQKPGNVYLGLVHRLDRPVGGIMVFAKTSKAAQRLTKQIKNREITKKYCAVVEGYLEKKSGKFVDFLLKDTRTNRVTVDPKGKESILFYSVIDEKEKMTLVEIILETGRSHQIRVQFSSRHFPLYGDQRYNHNALKGKQIALFAKELSFYHPVTKELLVFSLPLPNRYPFNLF